MEDPINIDNTVWSGCTIKHNEIIGIVIAVGKNTRLEKNSSRQKNIKSTHIDGKINIFSIVLFLMMALMGFLNAIAQGSTSVSQFFICFLRFIVLLSFMIPISIKLFIMLGRFGFSQNIMKD